MKIKFMGAARTVTGSCFIVEAAGHRFAVDCGMHQGNAEIDQRNWEVDLYDPAGIEFFIITHAHIDHSGLIPRMVQKGFHGPIYMTPPTKDLLQVMLLDSAHIQETEAQWKTKRRLRHGDKRIQPLYTQKDAQASFPLFESVPYEKVFDPCDGVRVNLRDAGHILGAALAELRIRDNGADTKLVFSGDLGRPSQLMMKDPSVVEEADILFMESTYGNRNHKNEDASLDELAQAVAYSHERGEKVIIPAFAVERTQEMIYSLHLLEKSGRLPKDMPVFVDSPLAIAATEIFRRHKHQFDAEAQALLARGEDPLTLPGLRYTQSTQDSIDINAVAGPAVVISASGMANAGRIKHHLRHNLWREGASIVFVGFQAAGTTGRRIIDGAEKVRLFGEDVAVKAKVFTINGFSAHAGQTQLLDWFAHFRNPAMQLFLVHGEYTAQQALAGLIEERFGIKAVIPDYLEETTLNRGEALKRMEFPEQAAPRIDWEYLIADVEAKLAHLKERQANIEGKARVEQTDLRDRLLEVNRSLMQLISES
ncbi:MAG: MBL fold metallo-hydrolase [Syntrophales bacterium]|jgi:metallo-beta-lactamase family protein|nr:MBL fold metallo-hydrolase [Syntrophales bacterium]MDD4339334.1 MBL fold metallo-hydrolase [Syntrophales bacterium]HOG07397.1 MBL fold metallo-hydrolase [Syntrophales bacterium]HOS76551.1 MBL fold metallo-hydrolase [Syntrophales bacterium]HPB69477.1 MBL fold metallo-hydrolase [Syntrophales bacterium]